MQATCQNPAKLDLTVGEAVGSQGIWLVILSAVFLLAGLAVATPVLARGGGHRFFSKAPDSEWQTAGDTIDVSDNHGGDVGLYNRMWAQLAQEGKKVRVVGNCQSACTTLLGHIPRKDICVTENASFGFHLGRNPGATAGMWNSYPADIRSWIRDHGKLTAEFKWLSAPDVYHYFRHC